MEGGLEAIELRRGNEKESEAKARLLRMLGMKPAAEAAGAGKKTKLVKRRVAQAFIDHLISCPYEPVPVIPDEKLAERSERFRRVYAETKAIRDGLVAYEQGLVQQYLANGYAEEELEVTDDVPV